MSKFLKLRWIFINENQERMNKWFPFTWRCRFYYIRGLFKKYWTFGRQKYNYLFGCL